MKILLLGGTGFVGSNLAEVLRENDLEFVIASRKTGLDLKAADQTVSFLQKNKPDFIVNCAAHVGSLNYVTQMAADVIVDNAYMQLSMYQAVAQACPGAIIINPIANCAYPARADIYSEENWMDGHLHESVFAYGGTRRFLWIIGEGFRMQHGIKSIYLFVPNMYGPYDSTNPDKAHALNALISKFVKAIQEKQKEITIWGRGIAIREWLYAKDFGRIVMKIIQNPDMPGLEKPVNIAQNFGLSVKELVEIIQKYFDFQENIVWDHSMPDGAPKKVMNNKRFRELFPDFVFTDLSAGISSTIKYYQSIYPY